MEPDAETRGTYDDAFSVLTAEFLGIHGAPEHLNTGICTEIAHAGVGPVAVVSAA